MRVVLISTYEMGRQPFGLASPAAWLRQAGATVVCQDLSRSRLDREAIVAADVVAFYVPMHTATRIAAHVVQHVKALNPRAHLCFYGLYAPVNEAFLRSLGAHTILGGEFEAGLLSLVRRLRSRAARHSATTRAGDLAGAPAVSGARPPGSAPAVYLCQDHHGARATAHDWLYGSEPWL